MQGIEAFLDQVRSGRVDPYFFVSHASADNAQVRPILEVLLDAGIPLWFDRPRDAGFEPDQFVGSLSPNEYWTKQLNEALASARGLIWFPSNAYYQSDECKRELACANMLDQIGSQYEIACVCTSSEQFQALDLREVTRQATRAFLTPDQDRFEIDPIYKDELTDLVHVLKGKLDDAVSNRNLMVDQAKAFDPSLQDDTSNPSDRVRHYTVPFRVNRKTQSDDTRDLHDDFRDGKKKRRPLLVCHGEHEDVSRQFISTTLAERLVAETGRLFEWTEQSAQPIRPSWPTCPPSDPDKFTRRYRDSLFEKFLGAGNDTGRKSIIESLAESFANDRCTRIVSSRLDLGSTELGLSGLQDVLAHITAWAQFWEAFPFETADTETFLSVIPVLEIVYDKETGKGGFFRRAPVSVQFQRFVKEDRKVLEFNRDFQNVDVQFLDQFHKITLNWVDAWLDDDDRLFSHLNDHGKQQVRDALEKTFKGQPDMPMKSWSDKAGPVLEELQIGIEGN